MIKFEHCEVIGWEHAIRGMRNPMNSWDRSDSEIMPSLRYEDGYIDDPEVNIGPSDHDLMIRLRNAGTDHRKFMRMINVYVDITAPLYWWKEFDTYKVGTVANSCSTMHKIHAKEFTLDDFSHEHLMDHRSVVEELDEGFENACCIYDGSDCYVNGPIDMLGEMIELLNKARSLYLRNKNKKYWWQMIQLLPSSYNQRRTVMMNYEVMANIYKSRKNHKLDEWRTFCSWIEELPYSEIIVGELEEDIKDIPISDEIMAEARRFPDPWPDAIKDTHPFLIKNLILPADEIRDGFIAGVSADPNTEIIDAINGIIEDGENDGES